MTDTETIRVQVQMTITGLYEIEKREDMTLSELIEYERKILEEEPDLIFPNMDDPAVEVKVLEVSS